VKLSVSGDIPLSVPAWHGMGQNLTLTFYHLSSWGHRNISSDNLAGGQQDWDLEGNTTLGGKGSEAASAMQVLSLAS
jgi:hypothetical protein